MPRQFYLFLLIFLEGYVVLSAEILAIRSTIPYVGSGTDTVSIIIAAVLMPLAFGYYAGGKFRPRINDGEEKETFRKRLLRNFMISAIFLTAGLSFITLEFFFKVMFQMTGINNRLVLVTLYSSIFLVLPVFLLGQTIPLVSNYFPKGKISETTGRILFFSTLGSFMGAVFSTLVLMAYAGVHHSVTVTIGCLAVLTYIIARKYISREVLVVTSCLVFSLLANSGMLLRSQGVVSNNLYNIIAVKDHKDGKVMLMNNNYSSFINEKGDKFPIIEYVEDTLLSPLIPEGYGTKASVRDILAIGAGGFSFGLEDEHNHYDYVDIDGSLKKVAEEHFLKEKLGKNKEFHPLPVRAFLSATEEKYDLILLDAYHGFYTMPEHLITREFFRQVKSVLKPDGILAVNFVVSPSFRDKFSVRLDNTFRSVFPHYTRQIIQEGYNGWVEDPRYKANIVYIYHNGPGTDTNTVYTDNLNSAFADKQRVTE